MADFVLIKEQGIWINLDYVIRVDLDVDDTGAAQVAFANGSIMRISRGDMRRIVKHVRPQPKKKKKKKKTGMSPTPAPEGPPVSPG